MKSRTAVELHGLCMEIHSDGFESLVNSSRRWRSIELNGEGTAKTCNAGAGSGKVVDLQSNVS